MINANDNTCFETPVTVKELKSCYLLITHQSYSDRLEKNLSKHHPPPPLGISVALRGGDMNIFWNYTMFIY